MNFKRVRLAALGLDLPERVVTSSEIERELQAVYARLGVLPGRLELFTGIRERRHYEASERPSSIAARAGARALATCGFERERIGLIVHAAVCRDFLEPATSAVVHRALELDSACAWFDLSNACLGFLDAMDIVARHIETGAIEAGLIVAGENGRPLVEATLRSLCADPALDRRALNRAFASLTIGAGGAAAVLAREELAPKAPLVLGSTALVDSSKVELCQGDRSLELGGPWMETDSEALLQAGNALAARTWSRFLADSGWNGVQVERVITHQVGSAHRRLLLETLALGEGRDFPTHQTLGNMGSVSLPASLALALEQGFVVPGQRVALLGIGSGLACRMQALAT